MRERGASRVPVLVLGLAAALAIAAAAVLWGRAGKKVPELLVLVTVCLVALLVRRRP